MGKKYVGKLFMGMALSFICTVYYAFLSVDHSTHHLGGFSIFTFHLFFFMLLWSFFHSSFSEPGQVPPYWGFYMGDSENKRKRYCLLCHVFKPDRCHHCSICNRCILNMDHHCRNYHIAWINNCIGFFNRKLFMLMLFYALISGYYVLCSTLPVAFSIGKNSFFIRRFTNDEIVFLCINGMLLFICLILTKFTSFHVKLILKNSTTIESLENSYNSRYCISSYRNFIQVFGRQWHLWPLPYYGKAGMPAGDGISWPMISPEGLDSDVNVESETNQRESSVKHVSALSNNEVWPSENRGPSPFSVAQGDKLSVDPETDTSFIRLNPNLSN